MKEYIKCQYCNEITETSDPTITRRDAAEDLWTCPDCEKKMFDK